MDDVLRFEEPTLWLCCEFVCAALLCSRSGSETLVGRV
jgi:hypothetical protein